VAFINDEEAAAAIEYALLLVMVAVAILTVSGLIGPKVAAIFQKVSDGLPAAPE
jgi:Flp pilus assembly pilin Flp